MIVTRDIDQDMKHEMRDIEAKLRQKYDNALAFTSKLARRAAAEAGKNLRDGCLCTHVDRSEAHAIKTPATGQFSVVLG